MADDLSDQWRLSEKSEEDDQYANVQVFLPGKEKKGTKRKDFSDGVDAKKVKEDPQIKTVADKKKRGERRRITQESEEVIAKPGSPEDVKTMMTKALKDRMSADALVEILPDSDSDFYPGNVKCLPCSDYLTCILPRWNAEVKKSIQVGKMGSPCVLVITSSAVRAVNLKRELQDFVGDKCKVAKLFSKHMKIPDQKKFLSNTVIQLGIGTPNRLSALIKLGALQLESLVAVVLDWNWRDSKMKRLPDVPEVRQDLALLLKDHLVEAVHGSPCRLALL